VSRAEALASAFCGATSKPAKGLAAGLGGPPSGLLAYTQWSITICAVEPTLKLFLIARPTRGDTV